MAIEYDYKELLIYGRDNDITVECPDGSQITSDEIYSESFEVDHSICDNEQLSFGECNPCSVKLKFANKVTNLKGGWIKISILPSGADEPFVFGKFKVDTDKVSDDREYREIVAYDILFDVRNKDVTEWYNGLGFPRKMKKLRDSFFEYLKDKGLDIEQEIVSLPNDEELVRRNSQKSQVYGGDVIEDLCRVNGRFGMVDSENVFHYVLLDSKSENDEEEEDESEILYETITQNHYEQQTLKWEDYQTQPITAIWFKQTAINEDFKYNVSDGANVYTMEMNIFQFSVKDLVPICENLYNAIKDITYTPFSVAAEGNPLRQCGDSVKIITSSGEAIKSYVLQKKMSGIQFFMDDLEAKGMYSYSEDRMVSSRTTDYLDGRLGEIAQNAFYAYTFTNSFAVNVPTDDKFVNFIQYDITSASDTEVIFMATIPINSDRDGEVRMEYRYNGAILEERNLKHYINKGENIVTICNYFPVAENKEAHLTVAIKAAYVESDMRKAMARITALENGSSSISVDTTPPNASIRKEGIRSVLFAKGLSTSTPWDGNIIIEDSMGLSGIPTVRMPSGMHENVDVTEHYGTKRIFAEAMPVNTAPTEREIL